jgi:hypothetical protein
LIGIDANIAGSGKKKGPPRREPLRKQIIRQSLARFQFRHLIEPSLGYV